MIYKLTIENFFSIADRQELTFAVPGNAPDLPNFRIPLPDKDIRLPTVLGFFGPNASGKSNILKAIVSVMGFVRESVFAQHPGVVFQPYKTAESINKPTKIIIEFTDSILENQSTLFRYELHVSHIDPLRKKVEFEALCYAPKGRYRVLFERKEGQFHFGPEFDISSQDDPRVLSIRPDASVISTLANLNHPLGQRLKEKLYCQFSGFDINGLGERTAILEHYEKDPELLHNLNKELRRFDIGIESIAIKKGPQGLFGECKHVGLDDYLYLGEQSLGTQRFVELFPRIYYALKTGSAVIIDELDIHFHPLIIPELFDWFSSSQRNPENAQLLFTAHNPSLLDELEKEQVFFTEKICGKSTSVYGARDIEGLRRSPSLMKKYLSGELGAVPHIG